MFKNYFSIAFRSIRRNISYTFLNVLGLTLGIASCLIIFLIVRSELGYDNFHRKADRIYRVTMNALDYNPSISMAIVPAMRTDFPELEQISQVWYQSSGLVKVGATRYNEKGFAYADAHFPDIFDYEWLAGNAHTALSEPNTIVLTKSMARKYFGEKDAMGQLINLNNQYNLKVTGVIKDPPHNSHLSFIFLVSFETVKGELQNAMSNFYAIMGGSAYVVVPEHYSIHQLEKKMPAFINKHWGADIAREAKLLMQPLREIHFDQRYQNSASPTVSKDTYWALIAVAIFIIVMACINFINLTTAQAIKRGKEVGVRKVLGAHRLQLIRQFLGETSMLVLCALFLSIIATIIFLPHAGKWLDIKIDVRELADPAIIGLLTALTVVIILLAGLYPAFVQSSFRPIASLQGKTGFSFRGLTLRKSLVFLQFAISQVLIIGTLVIAYQMDFFRNQDLGFNKEAVISFNIPDGNKTAIVRQQLLDNPGVKTFSFSSGAPGYNNSFAPFTCPQLGLTKDDVTELKFIDEQYTEMFGLKMLAGDPIKKLHENDTVQNVVINETLLHKLGIPQPADAIGMRINIGRDPVNIMGVMQDFQSESKHKKRRPCILIYNPNAFFMASVRLHRGNTHATIVGIEKQWAALFPEELFEYEFLDDHIAGLYQQEQNVYTTFKLFSSLAILIGCLGLYGLVAFSAVQRTKEVGIRKVLGASLFNIVGLFAKEFIWLIVLAFVVAAPVAYLVMHRWLENFAYQVSMSSSIFLTAISASFVIAGLTIGYQAIKAAMANTVKSLKAE